jgi:hypothetical protein
MGRLRLIFGSPPLADCSGWLTHSSGYSSNSSGPKTEMVIAHVEIPISNSLFHNCQKRKEKDYKERYGSKDHNRAIRLYPPTPKTCHHNPLANMGHNDAFRKQRSGGHKTVQEFLSSDTIT